MSQDMPPTPAIYALWDEMASFDATRGDEGVRHLLGSLCSLVDAANAVWMAAVRMPDHAPKDPAGGWRPRVRQYLRHTDAMEAGGNRQVDMLKAGIVDVTSIRNVSLAGRYRANRLVDLVEPEWFEGDYFRHFYLGLGYGDAIWVGCPVNRDAEVYFSIYRTPAQDRFTAADRDLMLTVQRGLRWFHRQQLLNHGLLVADKPLTPAERRVLHGLLSGLLEKQIAAAQQLSAHTVHDHVKNIYRKFGVGSRPELSALWLGQSPTSPDQGIQY